MQHYPGNVLTLNASGLLIPVSGASVTVYLASDEVTAATLYSDNGVTPTSNPVTTDSTGAFNFWVADNRYSLKVTGSSITTFWLHDIEIADIGTSLTTVAFSATPTFDANLSSNFEMTLTGNVTSSTIANGQAGQQITLILIQDATGSRTMTWPGTLKLAGGAFLLTTAPNQRDTLTAVYDGTNWNEIGRTTNE